MSVNQRRFDAMSTQALVAELEKDFALARGYGSLECMAHAVHNIAHFLHLIPRPDRPGMRSLNREMVAAAREVLESNPRITAIKAAIELGRKFSPTCAPKRQEAA